MSRAWQEDLRRDAEAMREYANELEAKLRVAEGRLADIAVGVYYSDEVQTSYTFETKLKITAARGLAKLAAMPCRKRPISPYF